MNCRSPGAHTDGPAACTYAGACDGPPAGFASAAPAVSDAPASSGAETAAGTDAINLLRCIVFLRKGAKRGVALTAMQGRCARAPSSRAIDTQHQLVWINAVCHGTRPQVAVKDWKERRVRGLLNTARSPRES